MKKMSIILIADDDPQMLRLMESLLLPMGYTVLKATNGRKAVEMAKRTPPDVILMDIQMPVMNGLEAVKILAIKEEYKG